MISAATKLLNSSSGPKKNNTKKTTRSFPAFYKDWLDLLKNSLLPLLRQSMAARSSSNSSVTLLGGAAMAPSSRLLSLQVNALHHHFQAYFHALDSAATDNAPHILSSPWRTPFERSLLWFGDLHPSLFLNLLHSLLLGQDYGEALREEVKEMECRVRRRAPQIGEMYRNLQERFLERAAGEFVERGEVSVAAEVAAELAGVFFQANRLRKSVLEGIVEALDDCQAAVFLEKLCELVLSLGGDGICREFRHLRVSE